ncbi:alpha/beta fold hydrolase [Nocardia uniformis]|uniref:Alpha/beta fold hydrolase n=1 Tax=Nocardia uniformis TaxID=53432 RepID=A0A849C2P8_9NOCA|nr:alpha/beta fold hydrolase [Nocardia uniformis]
MALVVVHGILSDSGAWDPLLDLLDRDPDLAGRVRVVRVDYPSKLAELVPKKQLPELDTVAGFLGTQLAEQLVPDQQVVFAAHSQGGLIVQRYLAQQLSEGRGLELRRIRRILMFATPNSGSEYLLALRKRWQRNPQERELRPLNEKIIRTQRMILDRVVHATETTATSVPIPIEAYAGLSDRVVLPQSATSVFPTGGVLPGDHSSIIRPTSADDLVYRIVKTRLLQEVQRSAHTPAAPVDSERVDQLNRSIASELRTQVITEPTEQRLTKEAVRQIAAALEKISDLIDPAVRSQFVMSMPLYVRQRMPPGGGNPRLELAALVEICAIFGETGREALVVSMEWAFAREDPAVGRALDVIEQRWPPGASAAPLWEDTPSHTA